MTKTKIILDADIIIHFSKGGYLNILPCILKSYKHVILDAVYKELPMHIKSQINNQIELLKNIEIISFNPSGEMSKDYAALTKTLGKGESACMAYCRFNNDIVGSSNLRDIKEYCRKYQITYLTTIDFLFYAIKNQLINIYQAEKFITEVRNQDSKLPDVDFGTYICPSLV